MTNEKNLKKEFEEFITLQKESNTQAIHKEITKKWFEDQLDAIAFQLEELNNSKIRTEMAQGLTFESEMSYDEWLIKKLNTIDFTR